MNNKPLVVWFKDVDREDVSLVGGKGANLGEMTRAGFPVPNGFIVTAPAYFYFLEQNKLAPKIHAIIQDINYNKTESIEQSSNKIQRLITRGRVPEDLARQIFKFYKSLGGVLRWTLVAVRSSATAEDLPKASFAGQQETYLNIKGDANLIEAIRKCWASLFTARAIFYRHENKFDHLEIGIAIPIQKMIESEISGVAFTVDPITNDKTKIVIEAIYGLGELIVQGAVNPDRYEIEKKTKNITNVQISSQKAMLVKIGNKDRDVKVPKKRVEKQKLNEPQIKKLAQICLDIEKHYFFPQDIEWAIEKGKIYIVQTRPVTTIKFEARSTKSETISNSQLLLRGESASPGIATGVVKIIHSAREIDKIKKGDVLVAPRTNPDFVTAMKRASGIVTNFGGRTSHAAIVSRELGIPAVVGTNNATKVLHDEMIITINGSTGEVFKGSIYQQGTTLKQNSTLIKGSKTATKLYVNLSDPKRAKEVANLAVDGVGLLRAEFMLAELGEHPKKLIQDHKQRKFVNYLAGGLEMFCNAFSPRPVIYRFSDFKTNEYKNLKGGSVFEPKEENPLLGYRGAFRYISDPQVFNLELEAIKLVREDLGLHNLWLMVPFVRTVKELENVKQKIQAFIKPSHTLKLWMMVEIPSNAILIEDFLKVGIDGISIGSNDLTMLLLGVDRDNEELKSIYSEVSPASLWAIERVIKTAKRLNIASSICGQAPSDYPELVQKLVQWGITSISVERDAIIRVREEIYSAEQKLLKT